MRTFQHYRGDSYWQKMKTEKQGPLNFFFPFEGIKDFGEEKMKEPVHDSFTLLDDRKSESREEER